MSEKHKMLAGEAYHAGDPELVAEARHVQRLLQVYNAEYLAASSEWRREHLGGIVGALGEESVIRAPFFCDYGYNIRLGRGVFANFGCIFLDVCAIEIGDFTQIGPAVQLLTPDHPRDADLRRTGIESGRPIHIGRNVWIGGGAVIVPGITVGDDAIIGAGSVVTRDVAAGATVAGNPARPVRARDPEIGAPGTPS